MNSKRKDAYIIVRVDKDMKKKLIDLAGGMRRLSTYIRDVLSQKIN